MTPTWFALPALITLATVALLFGTAVHVGRARIKFRIEAPATTGHPDFERAYRIQMNTTENAVMFLPALWVAAIFWSTPGAAALGAVWIAARVWYWVGYARAAARRGGGFGLSLLALAALFVGAAWGVLRALLA